MNIVPPFQIPNQSADPPRTRCGYVPNEVTQALQKALQQTGSYSTGRVLHFAADLICSGGLPHLWKLLWEYALLHIGLASPRVFVYLHKRMGELNTLLKSLPDELAYQSNEFQIRIGELVLVLRDAPTRTLTPWPKVGHETHDESWIRAAVVDPVTETAALRTVWRPEGDQSILRTAGANLCRAITEGSTERALFWVKWVLEEEVLMRKAHKGVGLSTLERGPASLSSKQRTDVSFFILQLYAEIYKELAAKGSIRMHEEFQTLLDLWSFPPKGLPGSAKRQILVILTQILSEVPRWKVPAAPALIRDPILLSNTVKQVPKFFQEVLAYDPPKAGYALLKLFKGKPAERAKQKGANAAAAANTKMSAMDIALEEYFARR